ncbi:hypothetical protein MY740_09815, partial [Haemophilus influenzae]
KRCNADGSVGFPHVRVGHRQVTKYLSKLNKKQRTPCRKIWGFSIFKFQKISKTVFVFTDYSIAILGRDGDTSCPYTSTLFTKIE